MNDKVVTLRLTTDAKGVAPGVTQAKAQIESLGDSGKRAGAKVEEGFRKVDEQVKRVGQSANQAGVWVARLIGGVAIGRGLRTLTSYADEYTNITGRLKLATNNQQEFARAQAETFAISQRTSTALESTVALYSRLAKSTQDYGVSQQRQLAMTETINKTFAISGASADAQKNTITQFTQALAGGVLRAEEFNSVVENAPRLAQALADGFGISMGKLRQEVNDGKVSVERMVQALESQADAIQREFEQMPLTVERSLVQLRNSAVKLVGEASAQFGVSGALAQGIAGLAKNLGALDQAIGVVAIAFGGRLVGNLVNATQAKVATMLATRQMAKAELEAARAAEVAAAAQLSRARAGLGAAGALTAAETAMAAATARTAAATQAASIAVTAKAASMRVLSGVMAAFGGPVGIVITGLTLLVTWLISSREEAKRTTAEIKDGFRGAADALEAFNKTPTSQDVGSLSASLELTAKLKQQVEDLTEREREFAAERHHGERMAAEGRSGALMSARAAERAQADVNQQLEIARMRYEQLTGATDQAIDRTADMILKAAGVTSATAEQRDEIEKYSRRLLENGVSLDTARAGLEKLVQPLFGASAAARVAAADFRDLQTATKFDWSDIDKSLNATLQQAQLRNVELTKGKSAALRAQLEASIPAANATGTTPAQRAQRQGLIDQIIKQNEANEKLTASQRATTRVTRDYSKTVNQAKESQARYTAQAAMAAAELRGPLDAAQEQNKQRIAELDQALAKHNITQDAYNKLVAASKAELEKRQVEIDKQITAPQALLDTMTGELVLMQQTGLQREITRRQLQAEADMRGELADAVEAAGSKEALAARMGAASYQEYEAAMLAAADASAVMSVAAEQSAQQAEEWAGLWNDAVSSVADAFTDFTMSGMKDFKGFAKSLKNIAKQLAADLIRTFLQQKIVVPIQTQIMNGMSGSGGFAMAGNGSGGGVMGWLGKLFGGGSAAQSPASSSGAGLFASMGRGWAAANPGAFGAATGGTSVMLPNGSAGVLMPDGRVLAGSGNGSGGFNMSGGTSMKMLTGEFANGTPYASAALGAYGLYYGATQRGNGGLSSAAAGLSYGALGVGVGGAIAGGLGALGTAAGVGGMAAGATAGATGAMASLGAAAWIPVVGWILAAAAVIDMVSGGKLFGTKFKPTGSMAQFDIGPNGASGFQQIQEVRNGALFSGRQWRTRNQALDAETQKSIDSLFGSLKTAIGDAAQKLGVEAPDLLVARFNQHFDSKGKLTTQYGFIDGRRYNEDQETFLKRLPLENMLNVAKQVGNGREIDTLADRYRGTTDTLEEFTTLMLAVQGDIKNTKTLWTANGQGVLTNIVDLMERLGRGSEKLIETYTRLNQGALEYGTMITGVEEQLRTAGLSEYQRAQLQIEMQYRSQVKQANDLAKAFGLSGARAQDLAKIEQLRALNMGNLQVQMEKQKRDILSGLALSDYAPTSDAQKLSEAMDQLRTAVGKGDVSGAQSLSQTALGLGRNLYASGQDYNALYGQVTGLIGGMTTPGLGDTDMGDLADILMDLPQQIASSLFQLLYQQVAPPTGAPPPVVQNPGGGGNRPARPGQGGYAGDFDPPECVMWDQVLEDGTRAIDVRAGDLHWCHTPEDGWHMAPVVAVGKPVLQPCVMLVRADGSRWCGSRSTPFTLPDAPSDLADGWTVDAPDMAGQQVFGSVAIVHGVDEVIDLGEQLVVPIDFGGKSFGAGVAGDDPTWSHNIRKTRYGVAGVFSQMNDRLGQLVAAGDRAAMAQRNAL